MPIKIKCSCGQSLAVSSKMAGKTGKCPKCGKALKIPAGNPKQPAASSQTAAVSAKAGGQTGGPADLDSLFDEAGLVKKAGATCPKCAKDIKPGTVICTSCGHNLETGEQLAAFNAKSAAREFDNLYLQEAADNMRRESMMETRRDKAQMPWWVIMSFLIGAITLCGAGVVIVDGMFGDLAPENTLIGKVQRWPVFITLGLTAMITGLAITIFAHLSITVFGFTKSIKHGIACLLLPLAYSIIYGILNWVENKAPVKAIMMALIFISLGVFLIIQGGGFGLVVNAFK